MTKMIHKGRPLVRALMCAVAIAVMACAATVAQESGSGLRGTLDEMTPPEQARHLLELIAGGRDDAQVLFFMGNALYAQELTDSAVVFYRRAVEADSTYFKAYVNMGLALDAGGPTIAGRNAFKSAIAIKPDDVLAHCHLGFNYFSRGRMTEAIKHYRLALEVDPNSAQARYNLGLAFADEKMFGEALVEWRKVIDLDPDGPLGAVARENVEILQTYMEMER